MPKAKRAAASSDEDRAVVSVDTDQADTKKAISRVPASGDDDGERGNKRGGSLASDVDADGEQAPSWLVKNRAMNKRIGRITRQYDQRMADQEARHQREMRTLRDEFQSLRTTRQQGENGDDAAHEAAMTALQEKLEAALEAGKSGDVAKLQREIARKEAAFWNAKQAAAMGGDDNRRQQQQRPAPQEDQGRPQVRKPSPAGLAFTDANDWWDDPDFAVERAAANVIFAKLVDEEGADPEDPATYGRVAKRLSKKFAELDIVVPGERRSRRDNDDDDDDGDDDDDDAGTRDGARRRAAEAPVHNQRQRDPDYRPARRGEQHLSERDLATMRTIGLNPDNNDHLLEFARGKREAEEQERSQRSARR